MRVAPGGKATICLGLCEDDSAELLSSNNFASGANQNSGNCLTSRPSTRLLSAPGGASTICLGMDDTTSVQSVSANAFADGANQNSGNYISDRPSTRLKHGPGGPATISLSYDETPSKSLIVEEVLTGCEAAGFSVSREAFTLEASSSYEGSTDCYRQAPGGASTLCLGLDPELEATPVKLQPPGGNATICLGVDDDKVVLDVPPSGRKAPGGDSTVCLGASAVELKEPDDFHAKQTPGGNSTLCLGMDDLSEQVPVKLGHVPMHAPGGPTTICLGMDESHMTHACVEVSSTHRCAPGGHSTLCLGFASESEVQSVTETQPVGGKTTICLGMAEDDNEKCSDENHRIAPGGRSTVCLGNAPMPLVERNLSRPAPGGHSTICLGLDMGDENVNNCNVAPSMSDDMKKTKVLGSNLQILGEQNSVSVL